MTDIERAIAKLKTMIWSDSDLEDYKKVGVREDFECAKSRSDCAKTAITALREQQERQWISVNDGLPALPQDNLYGNIARCWYKVKYQDGYTGETAYEFGNEPNQLFNNGFWESSLHGKVTHWMPLPKPPKEG